MASVPTRYGAHIWQFLKESVLNILNLLDLSGASAESIADKSYLPRRTRHDNDFFVPLQSTQNAARLVETKCLKHTPRHYFAVERDVSAVTQYGTVVVHKHAARALRLMNLQRRCGKSNGNVGALMELFVCKWNCWNSNGMVGIRMEVL